MFNRAVIVVAIIAIVVTASAATIIATCVVNIAISSPPLKLEQLTSPRPFITVVTVCDISQRHRGFDITGRRVIQLPEVALLLGNMLTKVCAAKTINRHNHGCSAMYLHQAINERPTTRSRRDASIRDAWRPVGIRQLMATGN